MRRWLAVLVLPLLIACSDEAPATDPAPDAPEPSVVEVGTYEASLPRSTFADYSYIPGKQWAGTWTLNVMEDRYVIEAGHFSFRVTEKWSGNGNDFRVSATPAPAGAFNCYSDSGERLTGDGEASAGYEVTVTDDGISFEAVDEPCELRAAILEREWAES